MTKNHKEFENIQTRLPKMRDSTLRILTQVLDRVSDELRHLDGKPALYQQDSHAHVCSKCQIKWHHPGNKGSTSDHTCPQCGEQQWVSENSMLPPSINLLYNIVAVEIHKREKAIPAVHQVDNAGWEFRKPNSKR